MKSFLRISFFFLLVTQICFAQGYWTKVGDMPEIRLVHTANELNGKIYIVGGWNTEQGPILTTALVYDRSTGTWTTIPLMNNEFRGSHTTSVVNGKLYVIGGYAASGSSYVPSPKVDMFDPNTGLWTSKNPMPTPRQALACASIEGKIYVMGGTDLINWIGLKTLEVYNVSTDTWTQLANMPTGRWGLSAVAFNGKIYVFGGATDAGTTVYDSVQVYDPQTNTWTVKSNMATKRYSITTCLLDSSIYVIGGWLHSRYGPIYDKVEVYNTESDTWYTETPMPVARALLASIVLDGKIYVYGGSRTNHPLIGTSAIYEYSRIVGVEEELNEIPTEFLLSQNWPNPLNPSTKIKYSIPKSSQVTLKIFNTLGEELEILVNEEKAAGTYEVNWNAANLPSGVYFYRLQAGDPSTGSGQGFVQTRKMILLK